MGRLDGRVCVVTGVASGLGRAIAQELAAEGAVVVGCDIEDAGGARRWPVSAPTAMPTSAGGRRRGAPRESGRTARAAST